MQHCSLPSELFNHTPQSGRFGFTSAGAYLFLGNVVFETLRVVNQARGSHHKPPALAVGVTLTIALPAHSLEKIGVRIDGKQFMAVKFRHRLRKQQRPQRVRWQAQQAQPVRQAQQARE